MAFVIVFSFGEKAKNGGYAPGFDLDNYGQVAKGVEPFLTSLRMATIGTALTLFIAPAPRVLPRRPGPAGTRACSSCCSSSRSGRASSSGPIAG